MRLREPFAKKHICSWLRSFLISEDGGFGKTELERTCSDCNRKQHARISRDEKESLPESLVHLGEFAWRDGPL